MTMRRFANGLGLEQGSRILFSDFIDDGAMWTGTGPRNVCEAQSFAKGFLAPPVVMCSISMWDIAHQSNSRVDLSAENVSETGFDIVFRTWGDTRVARVRVDWLAIGPTRDHDDWDVP